MTLKTRHTLAAVVLLLAVGCGAAAAPEARLTTLHKMERDYLAEQLLVEADAIAREISPSGTTLDFYQQLVSSQVPVYMANVCVKGGQPSAQEFTTITRANLSMGRSSEAEAHRVIKAISDAHNKWARESLDAASQLCLQPYLYPQSVSDAAPAVELHIVAAIKSVSSPFRGSFKSAARGRAAGWFQTDQQEPFISWICHRSSDNRCGL